MSLSKSYRKEARAALARQGSMLLTTPDRLKYSDDQARDDHGRWTSDGGGGGGQPMWRAGPPRNSYPLGAAEHNDFASGQGVWAEEPHSTIAAAGGTSLEVRYGPNTTYVRPSGGEPYKFEGQLPPAHVREAYNREHAEEEKPQWAVNRPAGDKPLGGTPKVFTEDTARTFVKDVAGVMERAGLQPYVSTGLSDAQLGGMETRAMNTQNWRIHDPDSKDSPAHMSKPASGEAIVGVSVWGSRGGNHLYYMGEGSDPEPSDELNSWAADRMGGRIKDTLRNAGLNVTSVTQQGYDAGFGTHNVDYEVRFRKASEKNSKIDRNEARAALARSGSMLLSTPDRLKYSEDQARDEHGRWSGDGGGGGGPMWSGNKEPGKVQIGPDNNFRPAGKVGSPQRYRQFTEAFAKLQPGQQVRVGVYGHIKYGGNARFDATVVRANGGLLTVTDNARPDQKPVKLQADMMTRLETHDAYHEPIAFGEPRAGRAAPAPRGPKDPGTLYD